MTVIKNPIDKEKYPTSFRLYNHILMEFNPRIPKTKLEIADYLKNYHDIQINFMGGNGDKRRTLHENIFHYLYGYLKPQVDFGTGKEGLKIWGCKKFTADFFDDLDNEVYEIDGSNHKTLKQRIKDNNKVMFFNSIGIKVYRYTNQEVQKMLADSLMKIELKSLGEAQIAN